MQHHHEMLEDLLEDGAPATFRPDDALLFELGIVSRKPEHEAFELRPEHAKLLDCSSISRRVGGDASNGVYQSSQLTGGASVGFLSPMQVSVEEQNIPLHSRPTTKDQQRVVHRFVPQEQGRSGPPPDAGGPAASSTRPMSREQFQEEMGQQLADRLLQNNADSLNARYMDRVVRSPRLVDGRLAPTLPEEDYIRSRLAGPAVAARERERERTAVAQHMSSSKHVEILLEKDEERELAKVLSRK